MQRFQRCLASWEPFLRLRLRTRRQASGGACVYVKNEGLFWSEKHISIFTKTSTNACLPQVRAGALTLMEKRTAQNGRGYARVLCAAHHSALCVTYTAACRKQNLPQTLQSSQL